MEASPSRNFFLIFLFIHGLPQNISAEVQGSSDGANAAQEPVRLTDVSAAKKFIEAAEVVVIGFFQDLEIPVVPILHSMVQKFQDVPVGISTDSEVLTHYNITENTISLFRQEQPLSSLPEVMTFATPWNISVEYPVDGERLNLESEDIENIDETKLSRFIEINKLGWVTEYNPVSVIGLFNSLVPIHLLLMMNKGSPEYEESIHRYQEAAKLFKGKILFVLVNSSLKEHGKVISFFKLKESQLPALAIYRTEDEEWDTLPLKDISIELVQNFCDGFLAGKLLRENSESEKAPKVEL